MNNDQSLDGAAAVLSDVEVAARAQRVRLVVSDVDGVLTDASVYYSARGEELKRFNLRDGMGVELLRRAGVATAFLTREDSEIVARRGEKLKLDHVWLGVWDKAAFLPEVLATAGVSLGEVAYIGDDVNDRDIMRLVAEEGLTGAPSDAVSEIQELAHFVTPRPGGAGAFRGLADWILASRRRMGESL